MPATVEKYLLKALVLVTESVKAALISMMTLGDFASNFSVKCFLFSSKYF